MQRTGDLNILCPICGKPDGCLVAEGATICSRVSEGSTKKVGDGPFRGGWLHTSEDFVPKKYEPKPVPYVNWNRVATQYARQLLNHQKEFSDFCKETEISPIAALRFNMGYDDGWFTVPLYQEHDCVSGIQRRKGAIKRFIKHSQIGVFVPSSFFQYRCKTLAVCEGFTDTVIALQYGLNAIGKFNCNAGDEWVNYYVRASQCEQVIIFADNDPAGIEGAEQTKKFIISANKMPVRVVVVKEKDLKFCHSKGMTLKEILK